MFYVYRHIRQDKNTPFYVGKGSGDRAWSSCNRNEYWKRIVKKHSYDVEIIMKDLSENQSFKKEIEFIKMYRDLGYCEANMTDGGEGLSNPTEEVLNKLRNRVFTKEHRKKLSEARKGKQFPRKQFPRKKLSNSKKLIIKKEKINKPKIYKYSHLKICKYCKNIFYKTGRKQFCSCKCRKLQRKLNEQKLWKSDNKQIICNENNTLYKNIKEAAQKLSISPFGVYKVLNYSDIRIGKYTFEYI